MAAVTDRLVSSSLFKFKALQWTELCCRQFTSSEYIGSRVTGSIIYMLECHHVVSIPLPVPHQDGSGNRLKLAGARLAILGLMLLQPPVNSTVQPLVVSRYLELVNI